MPGVDAARRRVPRRRRGLPRWPWSDTWRGRRSLGRTARGRRLCAGCFRAPLASTAPSEGRVRLPNIDDRYCFPCAVVNTHLTVRVHRQPRQVGDVLPPSGRLHVVRGSRPRQDAVERAPVAAPAVPVVAVPPDAVVEAAVDGALPTAAPPC